MEYQNDESLGQNLIGVLENDDVSACKERAGREGGAETYGAGSARVSRKDLNM